MLHVFRYHVRDVLRSRWTLGYGGLLLALTEALFRMGSGAEQVLLSLSNVALVLVPLVSLVFGTVYLYSAREFVELMLSQPLPRRALFAGLYAGLAVPLAAAFALGVLLPFAVRAETSKALFVLVGSGLALTLIGCAIAAYLTVRFDDRLRGLGAALSVWLVAAVLYDGLLLLLGTAFSNYPLEAPLLALTVLNPVDLARTLLILNFDAAALLGYTGIVFERFFKTGLGVSLSLLSLGFWTVLPLWRAARRFETKDF
ncbi:MAG: hypothetical protein IAE99_02870 [Rhodothermales bacterium]|nr:hypothetical protein [Rhodothermales bacterium]MCA0267733.1 hypothetical protein [Bacteroidota bacterium]